MLQEIFHSLYATRFTDAMIALQRREREILDASAERQVTRDEFKELARIRTEFRLRENLMEAGESNAANHFAVTQGRTLPYEIKRFSNIKQILHDQLRQPAKISAGGRTIVEAAESLDMLCKALALAFYSTNGLFNRDDMGAWRKLGVDPARISSPSVAHAGKKSDFDRLMDHAVGQKGLASLQPGNHERWMLQNVFTHSVQTYADRRCAKIDEIWDQYAAHHARILIDAAEDRAENMLNQKEDPDPGNGEKEKQETQKKNSGDSSSPDEMEESSPAKDKGKPEDSTASGEDMVDADTSPEKSDPAQKKSEDMPSPDGNPGDSKSPEKKKNDSRSDEKKPSGDPPPDKKAGAAPDQDKQEQDDPAAPDENSGDPSSQQSDSDEMSSSEGSDEDSPSPGGEEQGQGSESSESKGGDSQESKESGSSSQDESDDASSSAGDGQGSGNGQPGQKESGQGQGSDEPDDSQENKQQSRQDGEENPPENSPENSSDSSSSQNSASGGGKGQSNGQSSGGEESDEDGCSVDVEGLGPIDVGSPLPEPPEESRKADREDDDADPEDRETVHDLAREAKKQEERNKLE
ncbi:MAG TPA: hypothetical protein VIF12_03240, partial [Micavibrio sp.]